MCLALHQAPSIFAQTSNPAARKIDEFADIAASDLIARLDNLAVMLQNEPNARGFLIVYRSRRDLPGLSNKYAHRMKSYLVDSRGISAERVVTVDGGEALCLTQELWIVPVGATPQPRDDVYADSYRPSPYKYDEFFYSRPRDPADYSYWSVTPEMHLEAFAKTLQKNSGLTGYLIAFKSVDGDAPNVSQNMLRRQKNMLVKVFGIKPSRIKTIDGGYRKYRAMELWIVDKDDAAPVITTYRVSRSGRKR